MPLTPIHVQRGVLRAVASLNGRARCPIVIREIDAADDAPPLVVDEINPAAAKEREALRDRLPNALRDDGEALLEQLAECVVAERVTAAQRAQARAEQPPEDDPRPPAFSDDALALAFTAQHADDYRYTAGWGYWQQWDGTRWAADTTLHAFDAVRDMNRAAAATCGDSKVAAVVAAGRTVAAVERLARADRAHAGTVEQWDADPMLLNTPGGTVDLRTGALRPHRRADYLTKRTTVAPSGDAPRWEAFLDWATGSDRELQSYLKRLCGYACTGLIREHVVVFNHGSGGNGKGTFLNTVTHALGDYATVSPMDTFTAARGERHPTELAGLRGARLVTAQETEEGRRWDESRIKALTGGDPIRARFMRQDFFTFQPQFKLVIAGNHRPHLRNVDPAIRRRLHLIPWEQRVSGDAVDPELGDKLRAELPGILAWMIEGCQEWLEMGLRPPAIVQDATAEYFEAEDTFGAWMDECCQRRPGQWASSVELFNSWMQWAERIGERAGSAKTFAEAMKQRGFAPQKSGHAGTRGFAGIALKSGIARAA